MRALLWVPLALLARSPSSVLKRSYPCPPSERRIERRATTSNIAWGLTAKPFRRTGGRNETVRQAVCRLSRLKDKSVVRKCGLPYSMHSRPKDGWP